MYKVFQSFWSSRSNSSTIDEKPNIVHRKTDDDWVMINKTIDEDNRTENANPLEISWIKSDEQQIPLARFNPIENLLIEHASMSVYEDIASKSRSDDSPIRDIKIDEQTEDEEDEDLLVQNSNTNSIHNRLLIDSNILDSSTSSFPAHHRHLIRFHQRRKRPSTKSPLQQTPMNTIDRTTRYTPTTRTVNTKYFSPVLRST